MEVSEYLPEDRGRLLPGQSSASENSCSKRLRELLRRAFSPRSHLTHLLEHKNRHLNMDDGAPQNTADLTAFVQNLLQQMQGRFQQMSDSIIGRIDEMGGRIDELEKSIGELIQQAGVDDDTTKALE
mmetsp:Transcript_23290/g.72879  ORF Transcript_23290/g.72879 Transcript_23290/m.72879 type:complete len:127 (-) Transcript_23290:358-738(-)